MNRKEAAELFPIIKAFSEGKVIQTSIKGKPWKDLGEDIEFYINDKYRIKPESKYRPFANAKECWQEMKKHQPFGWVVNKRDGTMFLIRCLGMVSVYTSIQYLFKDAFDKLVFADLVPFGVKDE